MMPPKSDLKQIKAKGIQRVLREEDPVALEQYRVPGQSSMNMTLKVISVAPRALEIQNFLSQTGRLIPFLWSLKLSIRFIRSAR